MTKILYCGGSLNSVFISGSSTRYLPLGSVGSGGSAPSVENQAKILFAAVGTLSNLWLNLYSNTTTSTVTIVTRKNGANGNQSLSISAGSTGIFIDVTHTDSIAGGDALNTQQTGGSSNNALGTALTTLFDPSSSGDTVNRIGALSNFNPSSTGTNYYNPFVSNYASNTTESKAQFQNNISATLQNLSTTVGTNLSSAFILKTRKNSADGNQSVSVSSGSSGTFEDSTHTDSIVSGDLINNVINVSAKTFLSIDEVVVDYLTTTGKTHYITGYVSGVSLSTSTTYYFGINATGNGAPTIESQTQVNAQIAHTASNLQAYLASNSFTATSIGTFRKNSADGNQSISIAASTAGIFEDTTHTDSIVATDNINYKLTTSSTGSSSSLLNISNVADYGSGGTTYNDSISDSVTGADTLSIVATFIAAQSEAVTGADSQSVVATFIATQSESVTAADAITGGISYTDSLTESLTGADSESTALAVNAATSDSVTGSDSSSAVLTARPTISDVVTGADSNAALATFITSISDNATGVDAVTGGLQFNATTSDSVTGSDGITGSVTVNASIADSIASTDNNTASAIINTATSDNAMAVDSQSAAANYLNSINESIAANDSQAGGLLITGTTSDTVAAADAISGSLSVNAATQDSVSATDSMAANAVFNLSYLEIMAASDSFSAGAIFNNIISEIVSAFDAVVAFIIGKNNKGFVSVADSAKYLANAEDSAKYTATISDSAKFKLSIQDS